MSLLGAPIAHSLLEEGTFQVRGVIERKFQRAEAMENYFRSM